MEESCPKETERVCAASEVRGGAKSKDPLMFLHLADLHLAPRSAKINKKDPLTGRLLRDLDMEQAFRLAVDDALSLDPLPSAVVVAGDVFDTYKGSPSAEIAAIEQFRRFSEAGVEVLCIAGNHDTPANLTKIPMYSVLKKALESDPLIHLAYDEVERIVVGEVEYVLLPHICLLSGDFTKEDIEPRNTAAKTVLVVHGVAEGDPSLSQQDEEREAPIASWVLNLPFDYIAFGHYHSRGWVPNYKGKALYCGSLENTVVSGPDVKHEKGPVYVDMSAKGVNRCRFVNSPIRKIIELPRIDAEKKELDTPEKTVAAIEKALQDCDSSGAIIKQAVVNAAKSVYAALPQRNFSYALPDALYVSVQFSFIENKTTNLDSDASEDGGKKTSFKTLNEEIKDATKKLVNNKEIPEEVEEPVIDRIQKLI